ncbi:hypothetical protein [Paractinoplanes atraurantiacus]|uniref:Uncharacterized protein n=1 Tax=Paractinoplanes atraurantiacus TaxID=1036182 RepID=A0A285JZ88_9ACTN|nr:hypothetical protein [Actinoplanes atraurantiacus]SNY65625.1 hypothetical protein SAMN05421748_12890 [Actinoplanes atraurantiacus]
MTGMNVPALMDDGDEVADVGDRLAADAAGIYGWAMRAGEAVEGSLMCPSQLSQSGFGWEVTLGRLADEVRAYGVELRTAALAYLVADERSAGRMP